MAFCSKCGTQFDEGDRFCSKCGTARKDETPVSQYGAAETPAAPRKKIRVGRLLVGSIFGVAIWGAIFTFAFSSKGCSSAEGSFQATGKPLGNFTFTPAQCRSGEHESFFGVFLLGDEADAGGLKIVVDPRNGEFVQVEVPGSCKGPDNDVCTVVNLERGQCTTFDADIVQTNTYVNEIRLLDGHLTLDCKFPEGGTATANVTFESCD